jgi:hypothetical protein
MIENLQPNKQERIAIDRADTEVKWPKSALAVLFLVDGAGFGTWAAHVPVFKQFLHIVIVLCGIMVAVGPIFFPLQSTSRSSNEEAVTTGASVFD